MNKNVRLLNREQTSNIVPVKGPTGTFLALALPRVRFLLIEISSEHITLLGNDNYSVI